MLSGNLGSVPFLFPKAASDQMNYLKKCLYMRFEYYKDKEVGYIV